MRKILTLAILFLVLPLFVRGLTAAEIETQIGNLEVRAGIIEGHVRLIEGGGTAGKSKEDLIQELTGIRSDISALRAQLPTEPVPTEAVTPADTNEVHAQTAPTITSFLPNEVFPGSEVIIRGSNFTDSPENYVSIRYGDDDTAAVVVKPITYINPQTLKFYLPATQSFFGRYSTSVFIGGTKSNEKGLQVLKPSLVTGEVSPGGFRGWVQDVGTAIVNSTGNFFNRDPQPVSDPSTVLPATYIDAITPQVTKPGDIIRFRARGLIEGFHYGVQATNAQTGEVLQPASNRYETSEGTLIQIQLPQDFPAGTYSLLLFNPNGGYTNMRSFTHTILPACVPLPLETRPLECPTGQTGEKTEERTSSCPDPYGTPVWGNWLPGTNTCKAPVSSADTTADANRTVAPVIHTNPFGSGVSVSLDTVSTGNITGNDRTAGNVTGGDQNAGGGNVPATDPNPSGGNTPAVVRQPDPGAGNLTGGGDAPVTDPNLGGFRSDPGGPVVSDDLGGLTVIGFLQRITGLFDLIIPFIIGLTVFIIIWGIFRYILHANEEEKRAEAKQFIIYGIIGVFIMLSIWGFVNILINTFDIRADIGEGQIPRFPEIIAPPEIH